MAANPSYRHMTLSVELDEGSGSSQPVSGELNFPQMTLSWDIICSSGDDVASTWVAKPEVHAEQVGNSLNLLQNYSCQRRQLRTRRLITGRLLSDWIRVHATSPGIAFMES